MDIYTETMANVYAQQGHWSEVADIYRHLLAAEPDRLDYADALADAETKLKETGRKLPEHLVSLFREWIDLILKTDKLNKLKKLEKKFGGSGFRVEA